MFISNDLNFKFHPDFDINEEGIIESLFIEIITTVGKTHFTTTKIVNLKYLKLI